MTSKYKIVKINGIEYFIKLDNKQSSNIELTEGVLDDMTIKEFVNIKELAGFNYTDYLVKILEAINKDDFTTLKAITESDILDGLLPDKEIEKLRTILKDGFRRNQTVKEIENEINSNITLKDRITATSTISADVRANNIARTETVRLANEGLLNLYKENKIEKVRFLSSVSSRTCEICLGLNGTVYNINESFGIIPVHSNCRCSWISIIE
ncbi:MAG: minor capsid protein, partial [Nanoarchaeota archaeon]